MLMLTAAGLMSPTVYEGALFFGTQYGKVKKQNKKSLVATTGLGDQHTQSRKTKLRSNNKINSEMNLQ